MRVTIISLSYFFLAITVIGILLSIYYKSLVAKTTPGKRTREKILGDMKDPISWRERNSKLSHLSMFWTVVSFVLFLYISFALRLGSISVIYIFAYIALIVVSLFFVRSKHKSNEK
ncbi:MULTISPECIES: hypothetical protein [Clostridium]|uniref:hypothetical protein n=1 Tax=Clostridium TaxID=1485 RepID=UPI0009C18E31|nr:MULTISPECIES: hypothetical protein [Clostridium]PJI07325.1 hypothetical protein CUB90_05365 [Clostridium sp. CT7]